jgi:endoglucanase
MRNKNRLPFWGLKPLALAAIIGLAMAACAGDPLPEDPTDGNPPTFTAVTHITGLPSYKKTNIDLTLSATVQPSDATNKTITWSIANAGTAGATVANGVLKTTAEGTVTLTATVVNGKTANTDYTQPFTITVANEPPAFIPVSDITGVPTMATAGADLTLTGSVEPSDATNKTIVWSIANAGTTGATVVNGNTLKTTTAGTATVTATVVNGATTTTNYTKNFTITVTAVSNPGTFNDITAAELVAGIKIGWNLGNTLDAHNFSEWLGANPTVSQMETAWSNPVTTKAMITTLKNTGFNAIRIPVSWTKAAGGAPNYTIRADWMNRVVEVVNYAVENDMYIILNSHHDEDVFKFMNSNTAVGKAAFQKIWEQIAHTFKDYNEKLIFEGLNEPRTVGSDDEWNGGTGEERANINAYYQTFVDTVRASGGNNNKRILQINTYAASAEQAALNGLVLPTDTVQNKLIVSVHIYAPYNFAMNESGTSSWSASNSSDVSGVTAPIDRAYNTFARNGTPVTIGEFGSIHKNNTAARAELAQFYVSYATNKGLKCFWWDDGGNTNTAGDKMFSLFNRNNNTFYFLAIKDALINGAYNPDSPPVSGGGGDPTPNPITGNMGNFSFGFQENGIDPNYEQAVWVFTGTSFATLKNAATLVLTFSSDPAAVMQIVWQDTVNWAWHSTDILGNTGAGAPQNGASWNGSTKTLTVTLSAALNNYESFLNQSGVKLIICYYGTTNINDLGIVSANLSN